MRLSNADGNLQLLLDRRVVNGCVSTLPSGQTPPLQALDPLRECNADR